MEIPEYIFKLNFFSIQFLYSIIQFLFLVIYPIEFLNVVADKETFFNLHKGLIIIAGFFWLFTFDSYTSNICRINKEFGYITIAALTFLFVVGVITFSIRENAKKVLRGEPKYSVNFNYNSNLIKTNNNLVYVGKTEKYLFLRDILERKNKIYPMDKVELIEMINTEDVNVREKGSLPEDNIKECSE